MGVVTGFTSARMLAIEASAIVSGAIDSFGHLILGRHDSGTVDAGSIYPSMTDVVLPAVRDALYPVGCIYMTADATNPGSLFGGTWVEWGAGQVPVGVDASQAEFDTVEKTGGEKEHALSVAEMPSHTHTQDSHNHTQNSHNHTQNSHNHTQNSHNHTQDSHGHNVGLEDHSSQFNLDVTLVQESSSSVRPGWRAAIEGTNGGLRRLVAGYTTATNQSTTATNQSTTATNQATTATNQATTATNQATGGGDAHNNLQPYVTCYMWKRTA